MNGGLATAFPMALISSGGNSIQTSTSDQQISFEGHEPSSSPGQQVRLVQFVLDASKVRAAVSVANAVSGGLPVSPGTFVEGVNSSDTTCTLCGRRFSDRQNFNAHIRMHLKEKLNIRREQKQQKEQQVEASKLISTSEQISLSRPSISPKNIPAMLPSTPLPLATVVAASSQVRDKPDLESLLSQLSPKLLAGNNNNRVMAQLAVCQPIPPVNCQNLSRPPVVTQVTTIRSPPSNSSSLIISPVTYIKTEPEDVKPVHLTAIERPSVQSDPLCTPDISDIEEDLMSYEMDFHNDISSILDQLEKEFENSGSGGMSLSDVRLDTPPDSDSENSDYLNQLLDDGTPHDLMAQSRFLNEDIGMKIKVEDHFEAPVAAVNYDLLNVEKVSRRMTSPPSNFNSKLDTPLILARAITSPTSLKRPASSNIDQLLSCIDSPASVHRQTPVSVVQSPESVARVGQLPAETLAVLNKLPAKLFMPSGSDADAPRVIDVVKVERSRSGSAVGPLPSVGQPFAIINIECHQAGNAGQGLGKLIETYRAIDTGTEIKLLLGNGSTLNDVTLDKTSWSIKTTNNAQQPPSQQPSQQQSQPPKPTVTSHPANSQQPSPIQVQVPHSPKTSVPKSRMSSQCSVCGKSITTKNMARHMEKHTGKKKFECHFCSATFSQKMHLKNHVILHVTKVEPSFQASPAAADASTSPANPNKIYACSTCKRSFVQKGHLNRHIRTAHGGLPSGKTTCGVTVDQLTCRVCQKVCKNRVSLVRHRTKHLACVQCSAIFQNKVALQDHLLKVHPDSAIVSIERPYPQPSPTLEPDPPSTSGDYLDPVMGGIKSPATFETDNSPIGESLADIADTNFFDSTRDISDEFYPTELF